MSSSHQVLEAEESTLATTTIKKTIATIHEIQSEFAKTEKSESNEFSTQVNNLEQLFIRVDRLLQADLFKKPAALEELRKFLRENSPEKTDKSGTEYLGKLFEVKIENELSFKLARSLKTVLDLTEEKKKGFIVSAIIALSPTAKERFNVILAQAPTLAKNISDYEKAHNIQPAAPTSPATSSSSSTASSSSTSKKEPFLFGSLFFAKKLPATNPAARANPAPAPTGSKK